MSLRVVDERDWLIKLLAAPGRVKVTDTGYDFTEDCGEIVYEWAGGRFEVTVRELKP